MLLLQHPDTKVMKETVDELVERFHTQLDHTPIISLYDSDKGVVLEIPEEAFEKPAMDHAEKS